MRLPAPTSLASTLVTALALAGAPGCFSEPEGFTSVGGDGDGDGDADPSSSETGEPPADETSDSGDETSGDGDMSGDGDPDPSGDGDGDMSGDGDGDPSGDGDGEPEPVTQTVFVTNMLHKPNEIGGVAGAHMICQAAAEDAGLSGTFEAWISGPSYSPAQNFNKPETPYVLVTGEVVANGWADLTDGTLQRAIDVNEHGEVELYTMTGNWPITNTDASGQPIATTVASTCNNYGQLGPSQGMITTGKLVSGDAWSEDASRNCDYLFGYPLYCVEQ